MIPYIKAGLITTAFALAVLFVAWATIVTDGVFLVAIGVGVWLVSVYIVVLHLLQNRRL